MKNTKKLFYSLMVLLLAGVIYSLAPAPQKQDAKAVIYKSDAKKTASWDFISTHTTTLLTIRSRSC